MDVSPGEGGTVKVEQTTPSSYPFTDTFDSGTKVHLEAVPAPGYRFDNWVGDLSGFTNPATVTINPDKTVTANFSQITNALTIQVSGGGSTIPTVGTIEYDEVSVVSITATPDRGWKFDGWTGNVAEPNSSTTKVIIDSERTVTANFSKATPIWWFIGGILAAVVIAVAVSLTLRWRRKRA